jgi:hypothetical protein
MNGWYGADAPPTIRWRLDGKVCNATEPARLTMILPISSDFRVGLIANAMVLLGLFLGAVCGSMYVRIRYVGALGDKCGDWAILI